MAAYPPPPSLWSRMTFSEKLRVVRGASSYLSMPALLFLRTRLGYRFLHPGGIVGVGVFMIVVAQFAPPMHGGDVLTAFAVLFMICAFAERRERFKAYRDGEIVHTYYAGDSRLRDFKLPAFFTSERRAERYLDPLCWGFLSWVFAGFSPALSGWLAWTTATLLVVETGIRETTLDMEMDAMDGVLESRTHAHAATRLQSRPIGSDPAEGAADPIPTGLAKDVEQAIRNRASKRRRTGTP